MLKSITQWLAMNAFFIVFLLIFAGLVYGLMSFAKWITAGAMIEIQYFAGLLFGLMAVGLTIWLMIFVINRINRR